jgi:hypothetical protein
MGGFVDVTPCGQSTCVAGVGCVFCNAGEYRCSGALVEQCNATEDAWVQVEFCDGVQGLACDAQLGQCSGSCAPQNLAADEVGCEFYPTVTGNIAASEYEFQVIVINTTADPAEISIDHDGVQIVDYDLAANEMAAIPLPWIESLKQTTAQPVASVLEPGGAYRLRSTQPVVVTQWSPLQDEGGVAPSASNEASLLFPTHAWGNDIMVASRNTYQRAGIGHIPGFYAVTALEDATTVTLVPSPTSSADILPGGGVAADGSGVIMLDRGDVLEVFSGGVQANPSTVDLTGTRIVADAPIQVIGGHIYTNIPYNVSGPDHIEETMPPVSSLGTVFISAPPFASLPGEAPAVKRRRMRVIATEPNTTITYDPPQAGQPTLIAEAGGYAEVTNSAASFELTTSAPALVVEYMVGYNSGNINPGTTAGDPAMVLQQPVSAWKTTYRVHAPSAYYATYANILAPIDENVTLDGVVLSGWFVFGGQWKLRRIELSSAGNGVHEIVGTGGIGVTVYGYGEDVGFWYTGGYDLDG